MLHLRLLGHFFSSLVPLLGALAVLLLLGLAPATVVLVAVLMLPEASHLTAVSLAASSC